MVFGMANELDTDDRVQLTLRLPALLHAKLIGATAGRSSLNAEIIRRLERSFIQDAEDAIGSTAKMVLYAGEPLSWDEINAHVSDIVAAFPAPVTTLNVEIITRDIIARRKAVQEARSAYRQVLRGEQRSVSVIDAIAPFLPTDMSLIGFLDRVEGGEKAETVILDEVRKYYEAKVQSASAQKD